MKNDARPVGEQVNLYDLIENSIHSFAGSIGDKKLKVTLRLDSSLSMLADKASMQTVFDNMISNSVQYTPLNGKIDIFQTIDEKEQMLKLNFVDTGIGIHEEDHSFIFQPYFRANNAQVIQKDGNGLGLYLVDVVVRRLGGSVHFESRVGKGSHFIVSLPMER